MAKFKSVPYQSERLSEKEMQSRADSFYALMSQRRSVREFSDAPVRQGLIEQAIATAASSPSGAHRQPWHFVAIQDAATKRAIRVAAEVEERESYGTRMPPEWLEALEPLGTDSHKPFLETSPWLVVVFEQPYGLTESGERYKNYYVKESVGMACGLFIAALHNMGLATLTHTPSPMTFLSEILKRPPHERPFVLFPIGFPAEGCEVPLLKRKKISDVTTWL